ncbi:MAG TPA: hypothetical protein VM716_04585 [Gemmatimonadales bacterium]|nr:hypothetical protein [Gemmatimonadales bacterium]
MRRTVGQSDGPAERASLVFPSDCPTVRRSLLSLSVAVISAASLSSCTPVTTRPDFRPDPRALVAILNARPERVTLGIDSLVPAESLEVERFNAIDGYVETVWYDTRAHRARHHERDMADLSATVKIRFWADPWVPGQTRLTVEPVYRPRVDPSRVERDLEVILPKDDEGYKIAQKLVDKLKQRFGVPKAVQEAPAPPPPPPPANPHPPNP